MRELLEPEADRAEPLVLRRRARGDLEPVLDLEIGEMRLDHAEQRAAIFVGRHRAAQADAGFDARGRPDITGRASGLSATFTAATRRDVGRNTSQACAACSCGRAEAACTPTVRSAPAPRRGRAAVSAGIPTWNSHPSRRGTTWRGRLICAKPRYPVLPQRLARAKRNVAAAVGEPQPLPLFPDAKRNWSRFARCDLASGHGRECANYRPSAEAVPVGSYLFRNRCYRASDLGQRCRSSPLARADSARRHRINGSDVQDR